VVPAVLAWIGATAPSQTRQTPYAGQETRGIKALSEGEIEAYTAGEGLGLAKAAELNHYPGPRHVLDLAAELGLSQHQKQETQRVFDRMHRLAVKLGKRIVAKERQLDRLFASQRIDQATMRTLVSEISRLQGELRLAHLSAHLEMKKLLTRAQVAKYDELRGYGGHESHKHHQQ
jgi:Spy/CpxP family protein refolding chaperone